MRIRLSIGVGTEFSSSSPKIRRDSSITGLLEIFRNHIRLIVVDAHGKPLCHRWIYFDLHVFLQLICDSPKIRFIGAYDRHVVHVRNYDRTDTVPV